MKSKPSLRKLFDDGLVWSSTSHPLLPRSLPKRITQKKAALATLGVPEIDLALPYGGLPFGCLHEYTLENKISSQLPYRWYSPLFIVTTLMGSTLQVQQETCSSSLKNKRLIAWVGQRCWPTPHTLNNTSDIYHNSIFINPPGKHKRLWTITQILRCPSTLAVIADGSNLSDNASRTLQLAAKKGGSLGILIRPPWESSLTSTAYTKWRISPLPSEDDSPQWSIELLRVKGSPMHTSLVAEQQQTSPSVPSIICWPRKWHIRWDKEKNYGKGSLCIVSRASGEDQYQRAQTSIA